MLFQGSIPPYTTYSEGCLRLEPQEAQICIGHSWCQWLVLGIGAPSDPRGVLQGISCGPAAVTHWITQRGLHECWYPYQEYSALPVIKGEEGTNRPVFWTDQGQRSKDLGFLQSCEGGVEAASCRPWQGRHVFSEQYVREGKVSNDWKESK